MSREELPEGYVIPVHRSLTQPLYWMGVPRNVLLCEIFGSIFAVLIFKTFIVPVIAFGIHVLFRYFGQQDQEFLDIFMNARKYKKYYSA